MTELQIGFALIAAMVILVIAGMQVGIVLFSLSFVGIWLIKDNFETASRMLAVSSYSGIQDIVFATIPLFVLMGMFVSIADLGKDTFEVAGWLLRKVVGGLGVAVVAANAVFAAITGISIASAAVFTRIAVPELIKNGYSAKLAVGTVAGSSILGMLIPPSILFILYGIVAEQSIGKLFIAGIIPGLLVVVLYIGYILWVAKTQPHRVGEGVAPAAAATTASPATGGTTQAATALADEPDLRTILWSTAGIIVLVLLVLGGIWFGFFTPTEGAGVGATLALLLAIARGMKPREMVQAMISVGRTSAPLMILLVTAQL